MTILEAMEARHCVRAYKEVPLTEEIVSQLEEKIREVNSESGLHVQLILDEPKAFEGTIAKYGKFRGVRNYLVIAGMKSAGLDECAGYYGEQLVLLAQMLGLNTCWVGLSYSKVPGTYVLEEGEKIACYIALGYGVRRDSFVVPQGCRSCLACTNSHKPAEVLVPVYGNE